MARRSPSRAEPEAPDLLLVDEELRVGSFAAEDERRVGAALGARDVKRIQALLSDHLAHKLSSVLAALPAPQLRGQAA